jgi:UDP-GlcNAc3NAcA epimerase
MRIALLHIEAGERSFNREMPEEHNRVVTDALSDVLFCASHYAIETLTKEACQGKVIYSGDLMKDLLLQSAQLFQTPILPEPYIFCTIHRNYTNQNTEKLEALLDVLETLNQTILFPVHPATKPSIEKIQAKKNHANIHFVPPVSYYGSIRYQKVAQAIITDSGGMQKEAYWLERRCITVRKETEWQETLKGNWNQLIYHDLTQIPTLLKMPLGAHDKNLYGNGKAAARITEHLIQLL